MANFSTPDNPRSTEALGEALAEARPVSYQTIDGVWRKYLPPGWKAPDTYPRPSYVSEDAQQFWDDLPSHLQPGLYRYWSERLMPGGFLCAVIANDLRDTLIRRAPDVSPVDLLNLALVVAHSPRESRGSYAALDAWVGSKLPFAAAGTSVVQGAEALATARSNTFARRIAEALNRYSPGTRGY